MSHLVRSSLALLALTATAHTQQQVTLRGEIDTGPGASFELDDVNVVLESTLLNLNVFVEQEVELTGVWNGSIASPVVTVEEVIPSPETFEIGDDLILGDGSYLGFLGAPGTQAVGFLAFGQSFLPLASGEVLLVDPSRIALTLFGTIPGNGELELGFPIPEDLNLVGVDIFAQGATLSGGLIELTNADSKTVLF